jgi:ATP-dependent helicase HrpB
MPTLPSLPINAIKSEFEQLLSQHNTLVLSAPPGAGKSTCLPLWLLTIAALGEQKIYLLQPRRLAVKNIATFLASQLNEKVGQTVGYRLRHEKNVSKNTRIEVITEGILTQIIQQDAELCGTALIVFDEFHERSLQGDLAFALAREVQTELRDDLKLLLMSATLDSDYLLSALPDAVSLSSEGRSFPVELAYQAPVNAKYWRDHALNVIKHQALNHDGSILVFLPSVGDIRFLVERLIPFLAGGTSAAKLLICPLYGELSLKEQQTAISPCKSGMNKIVLATNIAETSLTIEGINLVIDSGLEKIAIYDSASLLNKLVQKQIAKASATQRAGRAGRLMPGKCIRLFDKASFERRPQHKTNDIQQADLLPTLIEAARWGVNTLADLPMLELPNTSKEQQAWQELQSLAIVDRQKRLTSHGEHVATLPCHPRFAHMIMTIQHYIQGDEKLPESNASLACLIAAVLEERDIFRAEQAHLDVNLVHRLQLFTERSESSWSNNPVMARIVKQANILAKRAGILFQMSKISLESTGLILALAYPERVAKARGELGNFLCSNGKGALVNFDDALANEAFLVVAQLMQFNAKLTVRLAASIQLRDIILLFKPDIYEHESAVFDAHTGKIIARKQTKLAALILEEKKLNGGLSEQSVSTMWCDLVTKKGLAFLSWQTKDIALKARWQWLNKYVFDLTLPLIDDKYLLSSLAVWFAPFVGGIKNKAQLDKLDLSTMLLSLLDYQQQQQLKKAAPTSFKGPTGRNCPITYSQEKSPKVSLPMQELYGLSKTPTVGVISDSSPEQGIPLLLELLSPAKRPIQVTQDLVQFWQGSYQAVQKDMKSNYPRHYWPDDPANAKATNKTKRHIKE